MMTLGIERRWAVTRRIDAWLPLLLLLAVLATVYLFGGGWGHFSRHLPGHDGDSAKNLAIAENLSPAHNLRLFLRLYPDPGGGDPVYEMYSRFPISSHALIKLAIAPFGDNLSAKLHAARILMLLMFAGAAALAYQSLRRITGRRFVALAATLLAFSSYYVLFFNDTVTNQMIMDLFAVMLAFHGMTVFVQERRFGQLWIKTGIALLLGWHVYALLLSFIALGLGGELIRAVRLAQSLGAAPAGVRRNIGAKFRAAKFRCGRYLILGIAAVLFGLAVLGFNLVNEYTAYQGEVPLRQLPSVQSMLKRTGQDSEYIAAQADALAWRRFLVGQFRRIGKMALPYALSIYTDGLSGSHPRGGIPLPYLPMGMAVLGACLLGVLLTPRYRGLLATLALSGVVWGILVRGNTSVHNFEGIFYIGIPLVLFALILRRVGSVMPRRWGNRALGVAAAAVALLVFTLSACQMSRTDALAQHPATQAALMSDFQAIRGLVRGHSVYIPAAELAPALSWRGAPAVAPPIDTRTYPITEMLLNYYFAGSVMQIENKLLYGCGPDCGQAYDFTVSMERRETPALLTPDNRLVFLYAADGVAPLQAAQYRAIVSGRPAVRADFDLYLGGGRLAYHKAACGESDVAERFFLHLYPSDTADLSGGRQRYGFESIGFDFDERGAMVGGECLATVPLPDYGLARIRTGQWIRGEGEIWEAEIVPDP